jgi:serine/threonine-protein kinase HipA
MGRKKKVKILNIYLNNIQVGQLKKDTSGQISFQYANDWLNEGMGISNSMPLTETEYKGEVVARYFDNLLPDNEEIKTNVATKFGAQSTRPFDMLEVIGRDCVGALSFLPEGLNPVDVYKINATPISEKEIADSLRGLSTSSPLGMNDKDFRISIAGAQEKTAFLYKDGQWLRPIGLTPTTHIFKTSIGAMGVDLNFDDSVDNEWFSLFILKKMGLPVCEAKIEQFENQRVLVVTRFDRKFKTLGKKEILLRIPQEDLCQALNISPYQKYQNEGGPGIEDISKLLMASRESEDRINFFKAIIIFDLLYATDGHGKNFSIFLGKSGFKLTPFYDVMSAYFMHAREKVSLTKLKLAMKVGDSGHYAFKRITRKHYEQTAKKCGISSDRFNLIMDEVKSSFENLSYTPDELDPLLNLETITMILEGMKIRAKIIF